jgi:hypothetical protein
MVSRITAEIPSPLQVKLLQLMCPSIAVAGISRLIIYLKWTFTAFMLRRLWNKLI